ncbi:MAG: hypothetical protein HS111_29600 [Kofleriaceae bacterium]|nr:hypothetical protein [Kofleriaceae bacterium]MCL4228621.1 hypothetical protein [Myxococcales bacterium]
MGLASRLVTWGACGIAAAALAACPSSTAVTTPTAGKKVGTVRMRAFTETSAVRLVTALGPYVFAAKAHGLERWQGDRLLVLSGAHGLPGDRVIGMGADPSRGWLWVVTDGGIGYYDTRVETFHEVPPAPLMTELGLGGGPAGVPAAMSVVGATDGGVWLGHGRGLFYTTPSGAWTSTPITDPVKALAFDDAGWLWVGTDRGLIGRAPDGKTFTFGAAQGNEVITTRLVARAPDGGVLVVGEDSGGRQRIAHGGERGFVSYKVSPGARWLDVVAHKERVVAMTADGLLAVTRARPARARPLTRDGVRLMPLKAGAVEALEVERLVARLPAGAGALGAAGDELLVATRELGVARVVPDVPLPVGWLRRAEMLDGANTLAVHCAAQEDCWMATGAPRAWRWRGETFEPAGPPDHVVLSVVRSPDGVLYGLHRGGGARDIQISRIVGETWEPIDVALTTPGTRPEVSFARFAPGGELWVGLRYHEGRDDQAQPWGVAIVDLGLGAVAYHHASGDPRERDKGILPVPVNVVDAAFHADQVWMASLEGAVRLQGDEVTVWTEGMELESELLTAIAVSPGGLVYAATPDGVATYDGERWRFPPELRFAVNDLALGPDARLWMATERGIAIFDGRKVRRMDVRRGLVENTVLDVTIDELGRVWARGPRSLMMVTP